MRLPANAAAIALCCTELYVSHFPPTSSNTSPKLRNSELLSLNLIPRLLRTVSTLLQPVTFVLLRLLTTFMAAECFFYECLNTRDILSVYIVGIYGSSDYRTTIRNGVFSFSRSGFIVNLQ